MGLGFRVHDTLRFSVFSFIDIVVKLFVNSTNDMQEYLADPSRTPNANRKGHLNSDIGGVIPKTKMYKYTDVGSTPRKKIMKKESGQG